MISTLERERDRFGLTLFRFLQKGANPHIKDCWGICDAFGYAKLGNKKVLEILNEWQQQQQQQMEIKKKGAGS